MDTAVKSTDKGEMIKAFAAKGVEHPWYYIAEDETAFETVLQQASYPCIMKPTDNSGSRGVVLCANGEELAAAYAYTRASSRGGAVIVEEYLRGPEVSVEIVVTDGVVHVLQITDKITTGAPHFVEMGHSQPSRLPDEKQAAIRDLATRAVKAVGIQNGPAHVEIIVTENGPRMVELGARMGGDCITTHLVPLSTGVDMIEATIRLSCGEMPNLAPQYQKGSAIRYFDVPAGRIAAIEGADAAKRLPGIVELAFTKQVGDMAGEIGSSSDRVGFVIAQAETTAQAVSACEEALRTVKITVE
jgi:biotin carboxylase